MDHEAGLGEGLADGVKVAVLFTDLEPLVSLQISLCDLRLPRINLLIESGCLYIEN